MKNLSLVLALALAGCSVKVDPFVQSDAAMMAKVVNDVVFDKNLAAALKKASGKKLVLVNLESPNYVDDELPEYMIQDALYQQLTMGYPGVELLERDDDIISLIEQENAGIEFCPTESCSLDGEDDADDDDVEARREEVAGVLRRLLDTLGDQDVVVMNEEPCCSADSKKKGTSTLETEIIANEIGEVKSDLIKDLVEEYISLYDLSEDDAPRKRDSKRKLSVQMPQADMLLSYRVYDHGTWVRTIRKSSFRISYVKLHLRLIDMKSGEVMYSGFLERASEDTLRPGERGALSRSKASQADWGRPANRSNETTKRLVPTPAEEPAKRKKGKKRGSVLPWKK